MGYSIQTIFSNFSHFGTVYIKKYPIDLVAIMACGSVKMVQFDGAFCHGCYLNPQCPTLCKYKNNLTRQEVEKETQLRDSVIQHWISQVNGNNQFTYTVIRDCCSALYSKKELDTAFASVLQLYSLVKNYNLINTKLDECPTNITFFALVKGHVPDSAQIPNFGPLFLWSENGTQFEANQGTVLLTKDYYNYLKSNFKFVIDEVKWCLFYQQCLTFPKIYQKLIQARTQAPPAQIILLKNIINFSCGYFGLNLNKTNKSNINLITKLPKRFNFAQHHILNADYVFNSNVYIVKTHLKSQCNIVCSTPLPIFIGIIEFGKKRLNEIIYFLHLNLRSNAFKICYVHIDSLVVAFSTNDILEAFKTPPTNILLTQFQNIFQSNNPGSMKIEWHVPANAQWEFVSPMPRYYAIIANNPKYLKHKISSLNKVTTTQTFNAAISLLNKNSVIFEQTRRTKKCINTVTKTTCITMSLKEK